MSLSSGFIGTVKIRFYWVFEVITAFNKPVPSYKRIKEGFFFVAFGTNSRNFFSIRFTTVQHQGQQNHCYHLHLAAVQNTGSDVSIRMSNRGSDETPHRLPETVGYCTAHIYNIQGSSMFVLHKQCMNKKLKWGKLTPLIRPHPSIYSVAFEDLLHSYKTQSDECFNDCPAY